LNSIVIRFPFFQQPDAMDCGPTCLRMVAKHYRKNVSLQEIRMLSETTREGSSLLGLSAAAEKVGFRSLGVKVSFNKLIKEAPLPCIAHWKSSHFVIVYKIKKTSPFSFRRGDGGEVVFVADPGHGLLTYTKEEFINCWIGANANENTEEGILLLLEPTAQFYAEQDDAFSEDKPNRKGFAFLLNYFTPYKKFFVQLVIGLLAGSLLQLIFPFLTQSIVDIGVQTRDVNFIWLILGAQLFLFLGRISVETIRAWILLHLSARINISLVSDFFTKLMKLPISYFDVKLTGDIMQRISDNNRIQSFLTTSSLQVLFSFFNIIVFGFVLAWYNLTLFILFAIGSLFYLAWIQIFMKRRADLDYKRFNQMSKEQSKVMEIITSMQEIKLNNAERQKRWGWEYLQVALFKVQIKSMRLEQWQNIGSSTINEIKNILITVFSAKLVIDGQITLGMMLAIAYITGQLNAPIMQLVGFMQSTQDAKLSLERLAEIHSKEDEEPKGKEFLHEIPENENIAIKNMSFRYTGSADNVLSDIDLNIPANKKTAIVGASGSGKTTLMKLLLKFYEPNSGEIKLNAANLNSISPSAWRKCCGVVMQEGYIFNDTIAGNIAVGEEVINKVRLKKAASMACIEEFIEGLALQYNTKIGMEGLGISTGQKQRMLIARAIYKNPHFLFFDEATSSLDANNESAIMKNLDEFMQNKTSVIIAHRLSTVKNADQIVVLDKGKIAETGDHHTLIKKQGLYFNLVKNQLDLEKL